MASLPRGKQQMVEICKALRRPPRVLILDEPTASLSEHDAQALFGLVRKLKEQGTAIIYITHRMHEIPALGDQVTVLRDGQFVATVSADTPENRLIELMTGRTLAKIYPQPGRTLGAVRLAIEGLNSSPKPGRSRSATQASKCAPAKSSASPDWSAAARASWPRPALACAGCKAGASCSTAAK